MGRKKRAMNIDTSKQRGRNWCNLVMKQKQTNKKIKIREKSNRKTAVNLKPQLFMSFDALSAPSYC